ncbi:MAG: aminotransferase class V-fold PLP-dependent enzyme, partial [Sphingobacterium sp.]
WLLSGFGNGFLLLSEELRDRLEADLSDIPAPVAPMWKGKTTLNTLFEPGHQDNIAHGTLRESLRFLHSIGLDNIEQHLRLVSEQAYTMLADRGLLLPYIRERQTRSLLINIQVDTSIYPRLLEQGIMCYPRGNGIRIGIHLYNTISDIEKLVELIEKHNEI